MREALAIIAEEGLPAMWQRHREMHNMLWQGLTRLGLSPLVQEPSHRLASVNAIKVGASVLSLADMVCVRGCACVCASAGACMRMLCGCMRMFMSML